MLPQKALQYTDVNSRYKHMQTADWQTIFKQTSQTVLPQDIPLPASEET